MGEDYWIGLREAVDRVKELADELALNFPDGMTLDAPEYLVVQSLDRLVIYAEAAIQEHENPRGVA